MISIVGQDKVLKLLSAYCAAGRLQGVFLFSGPEGVGKKLVALRAAQMLNCAGGESGSACGECENCLKIQARTHPDIHLIENGQKDITIDDVRGIQRLASLRPYEARKSVFIFDNAHRLNPESSNALLKIIEEPPESCVFFLVTDKPQLLFDTVISRCKRLRFCGLPAEALRDHLMRQRPVSPEAAHYAAFFSGGSIGTALALSAPGVLEEKNRVIDGFMRAPAGGEPKLDSDDRQEIARWCMILASWIRDICVLKAGSPESSIIHRDRLRELRGLSGSFSFMQLSHQLKAVTESVISLEQNLNVKLLLHQLAVQLGTFS